MFGATVTFQDEDGLIKVVQIVGEDEIAPEKNRISWKSPMARALLGKRLGDEVEIRRPAGVLYAEVTEILFK